MPYNISWKQHGHIILIIFEGVVTLDEMRVQLEETIALSETVDTPLVHTIVDSLNVVQFPKNIKDYQKIYDKKAHNVGWTIFVTENRLLKFFSTIVTNFTSVRFASVSSMHEAMEFISARDAAVYYGDNRPTTEFKQL